MTAPALKLSSHLDELEAESIHILREVQAAFRHPVMLYSIGKDSTVLLHLLRKAFYPGRPPMPLLHVDTTWKFREMIAFRDRLVASGDVDLLVHINQDGVRQGMDQHGFDAAIGGARRDEEKSRAKERVFSFRNAQHRWDPRNQRPEFWHTFNTNIRKGESVRVFPLSNWTEMDVWRYIEREGIEVVPLYFAKPRPVVERDGALIMLDDERFVLREGESVQLREVRFRTLGCYPLTGAVESSADTLAKVIEEMEFSRSSERQGRVIDQDPSASMERKKQEGYF
jgi:sulfate adenylyltransferase subunit 2